VTRKSIVVLIVLIGEVLAGAANAAAQSALLNLPDVSQHARITQRIGLTDITIDYHRPLVRGRKIFGGLQAYGQVWRAGADYNTTIDFTDPVSVDGHPLAAGTYGVHMIPSETSWVVIFSKNATSWGSFTYDAAEDALRVTVAPQNAAHQEALSYEFDSPLPDAAVITMRWEKVAVPFTVSVDTRAIVAHSLRNQLRGRAQLEWQAWQEAANYLLQNKLGAEEAATYADRSIAIEDRFENELTKARALTALGRTNDALTARNKALSLGSQQQIHSYARGLQGIGQQQEMLDIFRSNITKDPNSWIAHSEASRLAVAAADFEAAVKEAKLAVAVAPEALKAPLGDFVRQLEHKVDINK
jgi:tetratricopeptide (TPR) repeat protein